MHLWFACDIWHYINAFWLIDWLSNNKPQEEDTHLETDTEDDVKGPSILFREFEAALSKLKNGKAEGKDGISAELSKALCVKGTRELYDICVIVTSVVVSVSVIVNAVNEI